MPPPPGLAPYLVLQRALDREVLASLRTAAARVDQELNRMVARSGIGAEVRRQQLGRTQVEIHRQMSRMWAQVGDVTEAARAEAVAAGTQTVLDSTDNLLANVFSEADRAYMARSAQATAARGVEVVQERLSGTSRIPLAESVYGQANLTNGTVDRIINDALTRGASAAELARDVRGYINPNTPGGVKYAAQRLARTELNNAFHAAQVREAQEEPWVTGVKWHLSGSHPIPDECNEYAESEHFKDGGAGVFKPNQVPAKPHPNCLCFTTPVALDEDAFINAFMGGEYDTYLEERFPDAVSEAPSLLSRAPSPEQIKLAREGLLDPDELAYYQRTAANTGDYSNLDARLSQAQYQAFRSDYVSKAPAPGRQALEEKYFGNDGSFVINDWLRTNTVSPDADLLGLSPESIVADSKTLQKAAREWQTPEPVKTYRGMWDFDPGPDLTGSLWEDAGFQSTTFDRGRALTWAQSRGDNVTLMEVTVPRGTPAAIGQDQLELLIPDSAKLRVTGERFEEHAGSRVRILECLVEAVS